MTELSKRLRELGEKATPAPWKVETSENFGNDWPITTGTYSKDGKCYHVCTDHIRASEMTSGDAKADAELIAELRNNLTSLLDAAERVERLEKALREIAEGKGRFSIDPLTHAENTIEDMIELATEAVAEKEGE